MAKFSIFVPLVKVDAKQRIVYGTAVAEEVDKSNEVFDYATSKPLFQAWSDKFSKVTDGKSLGNVRAMHGKVAAGKLTEINFDDDGMKIDVAAKIVDDNEWDKIENAIYTGFSIGGAYEKRWKDGEVTRYTANPAEISIVDNPCGPSAHFTMVKADGVEEVREFADGGLYKLAELPADEELKKLRPEWTDDEVGAFKAIWSDLKKTAPAVEVTNDQVAAHARELAKAAGDETKWADHIAPARAELEKAAVPAEPKPTAEVTPPEPEPDLEQVWKSKDGETFKKKADAVAHNEELAKKATPVSQQLTDAVKGLGTAISSVEKRTDEPKDLKKGLYEVGRLASLILEIKWLAQYVASEQAMEGDASSTLAGQLKTNLGQLAQTLRAMVIEETEELMEGSDVEVIESMARTPAIDALAKVLDPADEPEAVLAKKLEGRVALLAKLGSKVPAEAEPDDLDIIEKALDRMTGTVEKAGARHSAADKDRLQKAHDLLNGMGAECAGDAASKSVAAEDLQKKLTGLEAEKSELEKAVREALPLIKEMGDRIKKLEDTPLVPPARTDMRGVVVDKAQDDAMAAQTMLQDIARTNPEVMATAMIKLAQQNPIRIGGDRPGTV